MGNASPFSFAELVVPSLVIFGLGVVITWGATRSAILALSLPLIRAAIFLVYFAAFFDGTWTFLDDWTYLEGGHVLLEQGIGFANFWQHLPELLSIAGGRHFVYYLFNADAFWLFGTSYYAPVALNVILTFVAAAFVASAARAGLGFSRRMAKALFALMVLYPDMVAWSTIMNGKDTLVMTCTAVAVYAVSMASVGYYRRAVALGMLVGIALFFTRFYVPLIMLLALASSLIFSSIGLRRIGLFLLASIGLSSTLSVLGVAGLVDVLGRLQEDWVNPLYGIPRYLLTPIPFNTTDHYSFLDLPQVLYWLLMPFLVFGVYRLWRCGTLTARFIVLYCLVMVLLYGTFGELQGPRHRYQLDGFIVLFQFLGFAGVLQQLGLGYRKARFYQRKNSIDIGHSV